MGTHSPPIALKTLGPWSVPPHSQGLEEKADPEGSGGVWLVWLGLTGSDWVWLGLTGSGWVWLEQSQPSLQCHDGTYWACGLIVKVSTPESGKRCGQGFESPRG